LSERSCRAHAAPGLRAVRLLPGNTASAGSSSRPLPVWVALLLPPVPGLDQEPADHRWVPQSALGRV